MNIDLKPILLALCVCSLVWPLNAVAEENRCPGDVTPAYWVAPMDPNFRRDAPGKSPMGMDLVPYCARQAGAADVSISPQVVQNIGVRTSPVIEKTLIPRIRAVGTVGWNENTLRHIHTRAEGWVEELGVAAVGDTVRAGQDLYALYSPKLYAAEAEYLAVGNPALRKAAARRLQALGYTSEQVQALAQRGKPTEFMLRTATADLTVVALGARVGQFVTPGSMMMVLADPRRVWLTVQVPERHAAQVQTGQSAEAVVTAWPNRRWEGVVEHVYPELDPVTRSLKVRLAFDNPDAALQPNMYAAIYIQAQPAHKQQTGAQQKGVQNSGAELVVPQSAVIRTGSGARVIKSLGNGEFDVVAVQVGHSQEGFTSIRSGLERGDRVVTSGQFLLDSEANVDAESLRLSRQEAVPPATKTPVPAGMAEAEVLDLNRESRNILLRHGDFEPIGEKGMVMPGMTMGFLIADDVDLHGVLLGDNVHVVVENPKPGVYTVTQLHRMSTMQPAPMDTLMKSGTHGSRPMGDGEQRPGGSPMPEGHHEHGSAPAPQPIAESQP